MADSSTMNGADVVAALLVERGVEIIFCITGAGNLALVDAIGRNTKIKFVFSHHEQAAVMEAQGYSRVSGKVGVALVTTGGGTVNSLSGILSAYLDSIPVLILSGNESSFHCEIMQDFRAYGVQGFDSKTVAEPITKSASRILSSTEITSKFNEAWESASTDRMGPVLVDFPMDLQRKMTSSSEQIVISASNKIIVKTDQTESNVKLTTECSKRLSKANRPLLYFGNGVRGESALANARELVEKYQIPFCLSWSALDLFEDAHPLNMGRIGIYGDRASNIILQKSDFILCVGTRLAIPQIGYDRDDFARMADRWIVDIDPIELSKFVKHQWNPIRQSSETFLDQVLTELKDLPKSDSLTQWVSNAHEIWQKLPRSEQIGAEVSSAHEVHSFDVINFLNSVLQEDAIIATDVGAGLLTGHYALAAKGTQRIFTSQGLGEMGFGLPGAIGAHFADPKRQLICLNTDGAIMFNLQELQLVKHHKIPMKLFIFNNDGYTMIKISQQNLFDARVSGSDINSGISFPLFSDLAKTFGFEYCLIDNLSGFESALRPALESPEAVLIEIRMSPDQKYLPRLATSKLADGTLVSPPLEDLDPMISIESLRDLLGYQPHANSYKSRGLPYEQRQN
jgi:acetolactate synthase-1/2/3 large subunit